MENNIRTLRSAKKRYSKRQNDTDYIPNTTRVSLNSSTTERVLLRRRTKFNEKTSLTPKCKDTDQLPEDMANQSISLLKDHIKLTKKCFVKLQKLTQSDLDLVKTIDSSFLKIKADILKRKKKTQEDSEVGKETSAADLKKIMEKVKMQEDRLNNDDTTLLNTTFTLSDEENTINNGIDCNADTFGTASSNVAEFKNKKNEKEFGEDNTSFYSQAATTSTRTPRKRWTINKSIFKESLLPENDDSLKKKSKEKLSKSLFECNMSPRKRWSVNKTSTDIRKSIVCLNDGSGELKDDSKEKLSMSLEDCNLSSFVPDNENLDLVREKGTNKQINNEEEIITNNSTFELDNCDSIFSGTTDASSRTFENVTLRRPNSRHDTNTYINDISLPHTIVSDGKNQSDIELDNTSPNNINYIDDISPPCKFVSDEDNQSNIELDSTSPNKKLKKQSIVKRLAKQRKSTDKSKRLSDSSKISKTLRLSSIGMKRTPKLPGSKSVQLYEFLTDKKRVEENVAESSPSSTSTPKILKNRVLNSLLKTTLKKEKLNVTFDETANISKIDSSSTSRNLGSTKKTSRVKIPNFALMHQKQFNKMESIVDYKQRTNERAKLLLSGGKPLVNNSNSTKSNNKCNKQLTNVFNKSETATSSVKTEYDFSILPTTPAMRPSKKPFLTLKENVNSTVNDFSSKNQTPPLKEKQVKIYATPKNTIERPKFVVRKTPFKEDRNAVTPSQLFNEAKKLQTPFQMPKKQGNLFEVNMKNNRLQKLDNEKKGGYTRFGFKVPLKPKKQDVINAVVNKTKVKNVVHRDEKRAVIKGVRSNRRFDLLMKMRQK